MRSKKQQHTDENGVPIPVMDPIGPTMMYVPYVLHRWSDITTNLWPMPLADPAPHCIGFVPVFDDEAAAKDWADGKSVATMVVREYRND